MKNKYLLVFCFITYGLCWGLAAAFMLFYDFFSGIFGAMSFENPLVILALFSANIAAVIVYGMMGGLKAIGGLFAKFIPRKKDLYWFAIVLGIAVLFFLFVRYGAILLGVAVPELIYNPLEMVREIIRNFFLEIGILGGVLGWLGFLLPYLQKIFRSNIKAAVCTGAMMGIYTLPGYAISSFEMVALYPLYIIQVVFLYIFISYMYNLTEGNLLFYLLLFGIISSGASLQLYYFNAPVQIIEIVFFILVCGITYFIIKKRNIQVPLHTLPEYRRIPASGVGETA